MNQSKSYVPHCLLYFIFIYLAIYHPLYHFSLCLCLSAEVTLGAQVQACLLCPVHWNLLIEIDESPG